MNPLLYTDYYKTEHFRMYPKDMSLLYSNLTARKSRFPGIDSIVFFGLQHFLVKYLGPKGKFQKNFFEKPWEELDEEYKYAVNVDTDHIRDLHTLGYLPLVIMAAPEGTRIPIRVPCLTIHNTGGKKYAWLVNYLETLISCQLWQSITSATLAAEYLKLLNSHALKTTGSTDGVQWQAHDFSMRGMSSLESAILSGMGHLTSFTGTDSIPAIYALRNSYGSSGLIGASVPATEHSVMCMGTKESEKETFIRLLNLYTTGILSVVSDTWDLWKVLTEILPDSEVKALILKYERKLVIRPDSGDPVKIITGWTKEELQGVTLGRGEGGDKCLIGEIEAKGVIELLWETFGGTVNELGYKVLDTHIGAIYGDSINLDRADQICKRLEAKGFASTNIVFGVGSFTYQYNTRDTFGFAVKATYGELTTNDDPRSRADGAPVHVETREIFKDPITDDGTKKSLKGLLKVYRDEDGKIKVKDQVSWADTQGGILEPVYINGQILRHQSLESIRHKVKQGV